MYLSGMENSVYDDCDDEELIDHPSEYCIESLAPAIEFGLWDDFDDQDYCVEAVDILRTDCPELFDGTDSADSSETSTETEEASSDSEDADATTESEDTEASTDSEAAEGDSEDTATDSEAVSTDTETSETDSEQPTILLA